LAIDKGKKEVKKAMPMAGYALAWLLLGYEKKVKFTVYYLFIVVVVFTFVSKYV
jgi:hypothetical protein